MGDAGVASIERLRGERDALKAQIAAMESAIPPDTAAAKLMDTMVLHMILCIYMLLTCAAVAACGVLCVATNES